MSLELAELKVYPLRRLDRVPRNLMIAAGLLAGIGLVAFILALASDADRAWRAYMYNWIYFAGIAQGAVVLGAIVTIARGVWSRPIRRIGLTFVAFLPIAYLVLFPPILIFADSLFPWIHEGTGGRDAYLNMPFLWARHALMLLTTLALSLAFAYWSIRPDAGTARDAGWTGLDRLTGRWTSPQIEEERAQRWLLRLAPALAAAYVFAFTFIAFDLVMALDVHWMSMLIGPYIFMSALLSGLAGLTIAALAYRRHLGLHPFIERATLHDLGKLMFGFCVFWAYLFWSQYIVIWYGNLPYEQVFLIPRVQPPYLALSLVVVFSLFVLPFAGLMSATAKKTPPILFAFAVLILAGLWLERYMLIYPTLYPDVDAVIFGIPEIAPALLMLGLLLGSVAWLGTRIPLLQVWRPGTEMELLGVEVEETR
jgi:hypothetical protein